MSDPKKKKPEIKKQPSSPRLPFVELAKNQKLSRPLVAALKLAWSWSDSTLMTLDELRLATNKWLGQAPHQARKRRLNS